MYRHVELERLIVHVKCTSRQLSVTVDVQKLSQTISQQRSILHDAVCNMDRAFHITRLCDTHGQVLAHVENATFKLIQNRSTLRGPTA